MAIRRVVFLLSLIFIGAFGVSIQFAEAGVLAKPSNNLGLIGYWSFEDGRGSKATDFSGNGNVATLSGDATWAEGKRGKALSVDGTGDNAKTGASAIFENAHSFTYAAWARRDASGVLDTIIFHGNESSGPHGSRTLHILDDNRIQACVGANTGSYCSTSSNTITDTNWHHYALTHDFGGDRIIRIYLDGTEVSYASQGTTANGMNDNVGEFIYIGSNRTDRTDHYFDGFIDEVRLYSRVLTASQIMALHTAGATKLSTSQIGPASGNLVLWHTFDGPYLNTTASTDRSGQGNNGALSGTPERINGKVGQAINFDGTNDHVGVPNASSLQPTDVSVCAWINSAGTGEQSILDKRQAALGAYQLRLDGGSHPLSLQWLINDESGGVETKLSVTSQIQQNAWTHVCGTYSDAADSMYSYKNGVQIGSVSTTRSIIANPSTMGAFIGDNVNGPGTYAFEGGIDDVRVYNKALSASEVGQLYALNRASQNTSQVGSVSSGLVLWHTFDGPYLSTTVSTDRSGNGYNGTFTNGSIPVAGRVGQGLHFTGTNYVVVPHNANLEPADITVCSWVKPSTFAFPADGGQIFSKGENGGYRARIETSTGKVKFFDRGGTNLLTSNGAVALDAWTHVCVTGDADLRIYINGVLDVAGGLAYGGPTPGQDLHIASTGLGGGGEAFYGSIDDVRIYNRALTASEVSSVYNGGR